MHKIKKLFEIKIAVIGLGYVGLPLFYQLCKKYDTIGFDIDESRVEELKKGFDRTKEISKAELNALKSLKVFSDQNILENANVFIITVPTPVDAKNNPLLSPIISASELVGRFLKKGDVVIYESTVYPGCTEEICVPILEEKSGLSYNLQFSCGYSPERINPGDKEHTITKIKKVTSGSNPRAAKFVDDLYNSIIEAGTFKASSIAVAEAAKVIENTQRDVNIALINELAMIFNKLNIDTKEVLNAASTKWNFLSFKPGLVGGHCIGVDPYYLTYKAKQIGYNPEIVLAGRKINNKVGKYLVDTTINKLKDIGIAALDANIAILGLTFKENCPDLRNSKVLTIFEELKNYGSKVVISDCCADRHEAKKIYGVPLVDHKDIHSQHALIIAVGHTEYIRLNNNNWSKMLRAGGIIIDVKSIYDKNKIEKTKFNYWGF